MRVHGSRAAAFFLACALSIIWPASAPAKTTTIDDSGTQAVEPSVSLLWKNAAPSRSGAGNLMIGGTTIRVRINVTPWLRRSGRIYLNLPAQQPGPINATWTTQGRLQPGQLHSGNRMLVYSGPITAPFIEEVLTFQFSVDATLIRQTFLLTFRFEMDEE